jgi:hypothetical protein
MASVPGVISGECWRPSSALWLRGAFGGSGGSLCSTSTGRRHPRHERAGDYTGTSQCTRYRLQCAPGPLPALSSLEAWQIDSQRQQPFSNSVSVNVVAQDQCRLGFSVGRRASGTSTSAGSDRDASAAGCRVPTRSRSPHQGTVADMTRLGWDEVNGRIEFSDTTRSRSLRSRAFVV